MIVRELVNKIGFKVDEGEAKNAEKSVKKMSTRMKVAIGSVIAGIAFIGKAAIDSAADMEMLTTQFEVMLGSTEKATAMMDQLKKFSAETPFALEDLSKGAQQLLSFGVSEDVVIERMRMLGDTAGGNAEKLNGLVLAYGKVSTKGKASMEELNMMAERGLPIFNVLAEQLNVTKEEMFKMVSKGQISSENITQAFQTMTGAGGMFFEGMKKQSMTFQGMISTMKDNFKLLLAEVGGALLPVMKEVVQVITTLVQGPLGELIKTIIDVLMPVIQYISTILKPLFEALIPIFQALSAIIKPLIEIFMGIFLPVMQALIPLFQVIAEIFMIIGAVLEKLVPLFQALGTIFFYIAQFVMMLLQVLMPLFETIGYLIGIVAEILTPIFQIFADLLGIIFDILEPLMPLFELFGDVLSFIGKILGVLLAPVKWIIQAIQWVVEKIKGLFDWILGNDEKKKEEDEKKKVKRPTTVTMKPPSLAMNMQNGLKGGNVANVNMTNNIGVTGTGVGSKKGAERAMKQAAQSIFTIEMQKILTNAGY